MIIVNDVTLENNKAIWDVVLFGWVNAETVSPLKICERRTCIVSVTGCNKEGGCKMKLAKFTKRLLYKDTIKPILN